MKHLCGVLSGAVLAALVAGTALAQTPPTAAKPSIRHGGALARHYCSVCHATGQRGDSPFDKAPRFRELGRNYPLDDLQEALAEGIVSGHPAMPQFVFQPDDVADFIAYLKSIQTGPQVASKPAAIPASH